MIVPPPRSLGPPAPSPCPPPVEVRPHGAAASSSAAGESRAQARNRRKRAKIAACAGYYYDASGRQTPPAGYDPLGQRQTRRQRKTRHALNLLQAADTEYDIFEYDIFEDIFEDSGGQTPPTQQEAGVAAVAHEKALGAFDAATASPC